MLSSIVGGANLITLSMRELALDLVDGVVQHFVQNRASGGAEAVDRESVFVESETAQARGPSDDPLGIGPEARTNTLFLLISTPLAFVQ